MNDEEKKFESGIAHFNAARFFEAHETWEELWLAAPEPEKTYLQGLIQVAAAFHHQARGNSRGAQSLLASGSAKLAQCPNNYRGVAVSELQRELDDWQKALAGQNTIASLDPPRIHKS